MRARNLKSLADPTGLALGVRLDPTGLALGVRLDPTGLVPVVNEAETCAGAPLSVCLPRRKVGGAAQAPTGLAEEWVYVRSADNRRTRHEVIRKGFGTTNEHE